MKIKKFLSLMLLVLVAVLLVACGDKAQKIADENLEKVAITYATGDSASSVTSNVTLGNVELEGLTVEWASDKAEVIANDGKVTRPAAGASDAQVKLTVTVKYKDASASKDFNLVVKALPEVRPLTVEITGTDKMVTGLVYTLTATVAPENATNKAVTWESDNTAVATVDANGKVTAVAPGTANIKAVCAANAAVFGTLAIEVADPTAESVEATIAKAKGEQGWTKGVVIATYARGFLISDGIACVLVYMNTTEFTQEVGDYVEVKGTLDEYNGAKQFTAEATITPLEEEAPSVEFKAEKLKDGAAVAAFMGAFVLDKKITFRMTVKSASDSYINGVVKGSDVAVAICYPANKDAYKVDTDYDVTAYALYVKAYNNVDTLYVMAEKAIEVDYGFDVHVTFKDGTQEDAQTINSLEFPLMELPTPEEKEGFVWLGWFKGPEDAPIRVYSIDSPEDITVYTRWVAEENAPLFVDPNSEEEGVYTSLTEALEAAQEGQEIILAPGDYKEEYIVPAERVYNTPEALLAAFGADFVEKNQLKAEGGVDPRAVDASLFETSTAESSWMTAFMDDPVLKEKWSWFFKGISEAAENEDLDPELYVADSRFVLMANIYGFFTQTKHTETYSASCVSADYTRSALVQKVILAGPKKDGEDAPDTILSKVYVNKSVKITGPNANIHGKSEERNEEANMTSTFIITADNVIVDGVGFTEDGYIQLGKDTAKSVLNNVKIVNCCLSTSVYGANPTGSNNRKGSIISHGTVNEIQIVDTAIYYAGTSYTNVAIDFDGQGGKTGYTASNISVIGCYFESSADGGAYEMLMAYNMSGKFNFIGNEVRIACTGYTLRLGYYLNWCNEINIIDNDILGLGDKEACTLQVCKMDATDGMTINMIGNNFENLGTASLIFEDSAAAGAVLNYNYNYFSDKQPWKVTGALASMVVKHANNLTLGEYDAANAFDVKKDDNTFADKAALDEAYAAYKATLHTVKFDTDGAFELLPMHFEDPKAVKLPEASKYGFVFGGWYDGETKVEKLTEAKDYNLKAKWLVTYYVTFDTQGGTEIATISFSDPTKVVLPYTATKILEIESDEGKKYEDVAAIAADFVADFKQYAGSNLADATKIDTSSIDSSSIVNMLKDAAMNAKWAWLYTALFEAAGSPEGMEYTHADDTVKGFYLANLYGFFNGEANHKDTHLGTEAADYTVQATVDAILAKGPKAPIYKHMIVSAWKEGETTVTEITELRNYNLVAEYSEAKAIKLDSDGAQEYETIYFINPALVELPTPSKAGYYFLGWFNGDAQVTEITEAADLELVAHWRAAQTITVDPNAGGKQYATVAALAEAYMADYNTKNSRTDLTIDSLDTSAGESSWMKAMLDDATLLTKWTWLYKALATASEATALDPTGEGFTSDGAKFLALANLYGLFHGEAHADPYSQSTLCADFSDADKVAAVIAAGPEKQAITTLAAALEVANAGDTIKILAGVYDEEVTVSINDLTIIGAVAYNFDHADEFTAGAADTQVKKITVKDACNIVIKNLVINNQINASNVDGLTITNCFGLGDAAGSVSISGINKDVLIKDYFYAGAGNRVIYVTTGTTTNVTIDHFVVMDAANVTLHPTNGGFGDGICDAIRFGMNNEPTVAGAVVLKNSYIRAGQGGIMDRDPAADSYEIYNNYFKGIDAPIYFRVFTKYPTKAIEYNVTYNTFVEGGNSINDWDVVTFSTNENTVLNVHNNAFIDSFKYVGTYSDFIFNVRAKAGDIDCSNNYFKNLSEETFVNKNAEGLTLLDLGEAKDYAPQAYDPYKIMFVNKKIYVYGVNYEYTPAFVKLDDADEVEVAVGFYELPVPTKEGWDFKGWFDGDTEVTEITEANKHYELTSKWENFSKFYNIEGVTGFYTNYEEFRAELLADINAYYKTAYTYDTIPATKWGITKYGSFFTANAAKYRPLVEYLATTGSACSASFTALIDQMNLGKTAVTDGVDGWKTDPNEYAINYTVVGMLQKIKNEIHASFITDDFSNAALQAAIVGLYAPKKAGYTFDGWYEDETLETPAETIEVYGKEYWAKWTELPKYDVTLTLNGGTPYANTDEMINAFIAAYAAYYEVADVTADNWSNKMEATCNAATWHYDDFFKAHTEWNWFLTFYTALLNADETWKDGGSYGVASKYSWRMGLQAYATKTERTSWPKVDAASTLVTQSVDWTTYYTATTYVISQVYGTTKLPTVYKAGYTFAGWFDNEACEGDALTSVNAEKTVYAKWEAVQQEIVEG